MGYIGRSFDESEGFIPETSGPVNYKPAAGLEFICLYGHFHFGSSITRRPAAILSKKMASRGWAGWYRSEGYWIPGEILNVRA
jgi:hypothetical protein